MKKNREILWFTAAVLLVPILRQYASPLSGVTLGDILLGLTLITVLIRKGRLSFKKSQLFALFWCAGIILSLISFMFQGSGFNFETTTRHVRFTFYIFSLVVAAQYIDKESALRWLRGLSLLVSIYIIVQYAVYTFTGIILSFNPLRFPTMSDLDIEAMIEYSASTYFFRPSGFFQEPGYAVQFMIPGLIFAFFRLNKLGINLHRIIEVIIISVAIVLTTSTQGILLVPVVALLYLASELIGHKRRKLGYILIGMLIIILGAYFLQSGLFENAVEKLSRNTGGSSTSMRIYRGFAVFEALPFLYKLIGIGHGNLGAFVTENGISTIYDKGIAAYYEYANGISMALLYYGLIGFVFVVAIFADFFLKTQAEFRVLAFVFLILSLVSGAFMSVQLVYFGSLIFMGYKAKKPNIGGGT